MKKSSDLHHEKFESLPLNQVFLGDNLFLLASLPEKSVDFVYIDGPYYTQKDWGDFKDIFTSLQDYLEFMKVRLELSRKAMKKTGIICLQADYRAIHYLKCELDKIFGYHNLVNELIWDRNNKGGIRSKNRFIQVHETILVYSKTNNYTFNMPYERLSPEQISTYNKNDNDGKGPYRWASLNKYKSIKDFDEGLKSGKYIWSGNSKYPYYKRYLRGHKGIPKTTVIKGITTNNKSNKHGYKTEKPEKLLELLIGSFSNRGDVVLDPFCGSGTACVVAMDMIRNFIGFDNNPKAIEITKNRLLELMKKPLKI
jgi:site-specific DNA-methyltransferase (adenine-specific)